MTFVADAHIGNSAYKILWYLHFSFFMFVVGYCWEQKPRDELCFRMYSTYICVWDSPHFPGATVPSLSSGPGPPHCRGFTIAPRHTTFSRIPLDEWSDRRRDFYLTASDTHKTQTSMPLAGFEPAILASERPQFNTLDRKANEIGYMYTCMYIYIYKRNLHQYFRLSVDFSLLFCNRIILVWGFNDSLWNAQNIMVYKHLILTSLF